MNTLFISDLHLDASRPVATSAFLRFLNDNSATTERLYILGDLFEAWIGDDDPNPHHKTILQAIAQFSQAGARCFFMAGNRDFLMGRKTVEAAGMIVLPDPTIIEVAGTSLVISHGDLLCTDDRGYQRFRRITRLHWVRKTYDALPFSVRSWLVGTARNQSQASNVYKPAEIMDVNQTAVNKLLTNCGVRTLLHGHTHRPDIHEFDIDGAKAQRIVLGDWYEHGSMLIWNEAGPQLKTLSFAT